MSELTLNEKGETGCCPRFNPKPWDGKVLKWDKKQFVRYTTCPKCAKAYGNNYMVINN